MKRQCTARSKQSGRRCRKAPIPGGTVCRMHGGGSPLVQRTARERLAALAEGPAVRAMERALKSKNHSAMVSAARDLLDRAGLREPEAWSPHEVLSLVRSIVSIFLDVVEDAALRREFALAVRRRLGVLAGDADLPVPALPPPPPPEPPPPAPDEAYL